MSDLLEQADRFVRKLTEPDKVKKHPKNFDKPTCIESGKVKYKTVKKVKNAINQRGGGMSHYKCKICRQYHITSK